ncbi:predicted protein [Naegleria gruberi]|uniref:Predicted protein n=1 Tax=Naegleria gruberi TaxID=5762 RepID=D2VXL0_NAEGR|nr:uncharacterized protein NAEGRDRAFT_81614 [Naegleria gruberi]EFC38459.1 predicted protein [Naegleria gruberi]|eukprot:XP_002671203.1 predicted protein [Naegleria gruberi strain NEG-M]
MRGTEGIIIGISCNKKEDIEKTLTTKHQVSLFDMVKIAKCDDRLPLPSNMHLLSCSSVPERKKDFRPILFFIHSVERKDVIIQIKSIIERVIEDTGYETHNTMIVVHSDEESNFYEGLEWLFEKRSD